MIKGRRSRTAEFAALQRAMHREYDTPPLVFDDDQVVALLSPGFRLLFNLPSGLGKIITGLARARSPDESQMRGQIAVRSRYTEDQLQTQLENGLDQYVILSAGLDTFALRRGDLAQHLAVFEVDQMDTQRWKRGLLETEAPENLHFLPVDFERQSIAEVLADSAFDGTKPAFFSWLGTTYYLSRDAIFATLRSILSAAAGGSELVLDYWSEQPVSNWISNSILTGVRLAVASQGEPMLSFFKPAEIEREVESIGFEVIENFTPANARQTYLQGRSDRLDVPDFGYLLHLRVPS